MMNTRDEEKEREIKRANRGNFSVRDESRHGDNIKISVLCQPHGKSSIFSLNFYTCLPYETPYLKIAEIG